MRSRPNVPASPRWHPNRESGAEVIALNITLEWSVKKQIKHFHGWVKNKVD